jgi:urea carboxylase-associated protein 1
MMPEWGETLYDDVLAPRRSWSRVIRKGEIFRVIDLEGSQAVDMLLYANEDRDERYHAPNTLKAAGTLKLTTGHTFYSDLARPLLTIVADSYVGHDTIGGCCSEPSNTMLYGVENVPGCRENFLEALAEHGMGRRDIVPNINLFMEVPVSQEADCEIATGRSKPGDYVDLRAEQDVLVALSNCPQVHNPCNAFNPTAIRLMVFAPAPVEIQ